MRVRRESHLGHVGVESETGIVHQDYKGKRNRVQFFSVGGRALEGTFRPQDALVSMGTGKWTRWFPARWSSKSPILASICAGAVRARVVVRISIFPHSLLAK